MATSPFEPLKDCPFCGSHAMTVQEGYEEAATEFYIECTMCGGGSNRFVIGELYDGTLLECEDKARAAWNRRV